MLVTNSVCRLVAPSERLTRCLHCSARLLSQDNGSRAGGNDGDDAAPTSASAFLLAQAAEEEAQLASTSTSKADVPELRERAWDGDEPQDRAIRRILQDSYKPLRVKGFQKQIQKPTPLPESIFGDVRRAAPSASSSTLADEPSKPLEPWEYTFKAPQWHTQAPTRSQKMLRVPTRTQRAPKPSERLSAALEKAWDHRSGHGKVKVPDEPKAPGGMRMYGGFVEDKIQQAIAQGAFRSIKGRGKPIVRDPLESNPFIPRDEFLINRIVQGQGAAPPWVDLQGEVEESLTVFRTELRDRWTRRAIRMKSLGGVTRTEIDSVRQMWRDQEWEDRERKFHNLSVETVNNTIRRYNALAPYSVRKALLSVEDEIQSAVKQCAPTIVQELERRLAGGSSSYSVERDASPLENEGREAEREEKVVRESMWRAFKRLVRQVVGQEPHGTAEQRARV